MPKNKILCDLSRQSLKRRLYYKTKRSNTNCHNKDLKKLDSAPIESNKINVNQNNRAQLELLNDSNEVDLNVAEPLIEFNDVEETLSEIEHDDDDDDDIKDECENSSIADFLLIWAPKYNIKANALNELLQFLKHSIGLNVPTDSRTLLKTPQNREVLDCPPGKYVHIGFKSNFDNLLAKFKNVSLLELDFNIDGVPITKSNRSCFWPVLCRVWNLDKRFIFVVGIYHGYNKPNDFNQYLRPLVSELKELLMNGYENSSNNICVKVRAIICDAPARSGLLGTKSHTGYFGCLKCTEEGEFIKNRMIFPVENNCKLRTDSSFRQRVQSEHHKFNSILEELPIDMIKQFPLEYLHLVCLGVMKKLLQMWLAGDSKSLLSTIEIQKISDNLRQISLTQPCDFQRSIRPLNDFAFFKGTEFRVFLLYSGPFVLRDIIAIEKYNHFMLLHVGILLLCHIEFSKTKIKVADKILRQFVNATSFIYGRHHLTYNMHCLIHLAQDVQQFGNLDEFSAFAFESFMSVLKRLLKKPNQPLAQICNRIFELNNAKVLNSDRHNLDTTYPKLQRRYFKEGRSFYNRISFNNFEIRNDSRNCWILLKSKTIVKFLRAEVIKNETFIWGRQAIDPTDFYNIPIASSKLDIFEATFSDSGQSEKQYNCKEIEKKLFAMKRSKPERFVFFPILHSIV